MFLGSIYVGEANGDEPAAPSRKVIQVPNQKFTRPTPQRPQIQGKQQWQRPQPQQPRLNINTHLDTIIIMHL